MAKESQKGTLLRELCFSGSHIWINNDIMYSMDEKVLDLPSPGLWNG